MLLSTKNARAIAKRNALERRQSAELKKFSKTVPIPEGFTAGFEIEQYYSTEVFVIRKQDDIEFIFRPSGDGTTRHKFNNNWYSFDRTGVESSFYWINFGPGEKPIKDIDQVIAKQLERIAKSRAFHNTAISIPDVGHSVDPAGVQTLKDQFRRKGSVAFYPSGFGTGYRVQRTRPKHNYGVRQGSTALASFLGYDGPVWIVSFDCD